MFYWKWTRKGKVSTKYVSLVLDFPNSNLTDNLLNLSFLECEDVLCLMQDVEDFNSENNYFVGINKGDFAKTLRQLGYQHPENYSQKRYERNLVLDKAITGKHIGSPLDLGKSDRDDELVIHLDTKRLRVAFLLKANDMNLKVYQINNQFINEDSYFDLMPNYWNYTHA